MKIVALISWYMEPPAWLAATVASIGRFADHLVAVDGAYGLIQDSTFAPRSGREQVEAIAAAADGTGLGYTIHAPNQPWYGNEVEKRSFLFAAGLLVAEPEDWFFVIDGDELVTHVPEDLREQLDHVEGLVASVDYVERSADQPLPEQNCRHEWLPVSQVSHGGRRTFFRAVPGLHVVGNHYTYVDGEGRYLWGNPGELPVESATALDCFRVEHWHRFRQPARQKLSYDYYRVRDALGIETARP